jgi:biotin transport system substrate-specific component
MAVTLTTPKTLLGTLAPKTDTARLASAFATVVLGTLFITLCSKINVPTWPVPVTLQTFAVAALAAAFGWRIGVATVALYILEGLSGLPVFSGPAAGPLYALSPAFGFIVGFLPMAFIVGKAADEGLSRSMFQLFAVALAADALCFLIGFAWLAAYITTATGAALPDVLGPAFTKGVQPFLVWDIIKMGFAAVSVAGAWTFVRRKD